MKLKHLFFLPFLIMLAAGCSKPKKNDLTFTVPTGTFSGTFKQLRFNAANNDYDSVLTNISVSMDLKDGYHVTADSTIHANSYGNFSVNPYYIAFDDFTFSGTELPTIPHLLGTYGYDYDGSKLHMQQTYSDTLGFFYDLVKQ